MKFLILTVLFSVIATTLAILCRQAGLLPYTSNGCFNDGTKLCEPEIGVQKACEGKLGPTTKWKPGKKIATACQIGAQPPILTAIATFQGLPGDLYNGNYKHSAIFLGCGKNGAIKVMDQKKNKKWGENFIIQNGPGVNASSLYYEILV